MKVLNALIPGSFDPPTKGHFDLISRASFLCENLYVVIAENPDKKYLFSTAERKQFLEQMLSGYKNIKVVLWDGLIVDFCRKFNAYLIVRGLRNSADVDYEKALEKAYKTDLPQVEVCYLLSKPEFKDISSSKVKESALSGKGIEEYIPKALAECIVNKVRLLT